MKNEWQEGEAHHFCENDPPLGATEDAKENVTMGGS